VSEDRIGPAIKDECAVAGRELDPYLPFFIAEG